MDYLKQNLPLHLKNTHAFAPSSFLWNILSSFIAQLLGTVAWLQSQQSIPTRSDPCEAPRTVFDLFFLPLASPALPDIPVLASFLGDLHSSQKNTQGNPHNSGNHSITLPRRD